MQKTFKKALSIALCIMLALSTFSGVFSISAQSGTANAAPMNLDFSNGLSYWTGDTEKFTIIGGKLTTTQGGTSTITTEEFNIPNLKAGDEVKFSLFLDSQAVGNSVTATLAQVGTGLNLSKTFNTNFGLYMTGKEGSTTKGACVTVADPTVPFTLSIVNHSATAGDWTISDIKILVQNQTAEELYISQGYFPSYTAYTNGTDTHQVYFDGTVEGGTEEDGYTANTTTLQYLARLGILDSPKNLDFTQGLKYWGAAFSTSTKFTQVTAASDKATVDENGILTFLPKTGSSVITTQKFKVNDVAPGEKVTFLLQWRANPEDAAKTYQTDIQMQAQVFPTAGIQKQGYPYGWSTQQKAIQPTTSYTIDVPYCEAGQTNDGWYCVSASYTAATADDVYSISLNYGTRGTKNAETGIYDDVARIQVRCVRVLKPLAEGGYIDLSSGEKLSRDFQPFGGTEEAGITQMFKNGQVVNRYLQNASYNHLFSLGIYGYNNGFLNGDFSQGFKYWNATYDTGIAATKDVRGWASVDDAGVVSFNQITQKDDGTAVTSSNVAQTIYSQPFVLSGLEAGDKLVAAVDAGSETRLRVEIKEFALNANLEQLSGEIGIGDLTNTNWGPFGGTLFSGSLTVTNPANLFFIRIRNEKPTSTGAQMTNVRIYKQLANGELVDVSKGFSADAPTVNANGGSPEKGLFTSAGVATAPTNNDLLNGDFSEGLKHWGAYGVSGYATLTAEIRDGALAIPFKSENGIKSSFITFAPEYVGKEAVFAFYAGAFQGSANYIYAIYENGVSLFNTTGASYEGINNSITGNIASDRITIKEGAKYQFTIKNSAGGTSVLKIDDVKLLIVDDTETVEMYTDVSGNRYLGSVMKYQPLGGTEEEGIIPSASLPGAGIPDGSWFNRTATYVPANNGLKNGDFSQGFKYWVRWGYDAPTLTETFTLDRDTGVMKLAEGGTGTGMYSQHFTLEGIKVGDVIYSAVDNRKSSNTLGLSVSLQTFRKNGESYQWLNANGGNPRLNQSETWQTNYSNGFVVEDVNTMFAIGIQVSVNERFAGEFKNARVIRNDRGGLKVMKNGVLTEAIPKVNADGTLEETQLYGDANNDKAVNLLDIVRMKREAAYGEYNDLGIFLAAVDFDNDDVIGATDFTAVIGKVLDPTVVLTK